MQGHVHRRGTEGVEDWRSPCEDGGGDGSDAATSQGMLGSTIDQKQGSFLR